MIEILLENFFHPVVVIKEKEKPIEDVLNYLIMVLMKNQFMTSCTP